MPQRAAIMAAEARQIRPPASYNIGLSSAPLIEQLRPDGPSFNFNHSDH